jgi:hypothetical protein
MKRGERGGDGLTHRQRNLVAAYKTRTPDEPLYEIGRRAGWKAKSKDHLTDQVSSALKTPAVQVALRHDPAPKGAKPKITPEFLRRRAREIVLDPLTPKGELLKALRFLAEMTPGALVPLGVNLSGRLGIEDFVRAAGGAPEERPALPLLQKYQPRS